MARCPIFQQASALSLHGAFIGKPVAAWLRLRLRPIVYGLPRSDLGWLIRSGVLRASPDLGFKVRGACGDYWLGEASPKVRAAGLLVAPSGLDRERLHFHPGPDGS